MLSSCSAFTQRLLSFCSAFAKLLICSYSALTQYLLQFAQLLLIRLVFQGLEYLWSKMSLYRLLSFLPLLNICSFYAHLFFVPYCIFLYFSHTCALPKRYSKFYYILLGRLKVNKTIRLRSFLWAWMANWLAFACQCVKFDFIAWFWFAPNPFYFSVNNIPYLYPFNQIVSL